MPIGWSYVGPSVLASFLASFVECVEALTVVLAVGSVRSWTGALSGAAAAIALLFLIIAVLGKALTRLPIHPLQMVVGALLILFGLRWLRKAILRSAGEISLHDEDAVFSKKTASMRTESAVQGWDHVAFAASFQITMLEGTEVVFIVIAIGAGGSGLLIPACAGAMGALLFAVGLGSALRRPLTKVPENTLKFAVGILLSAFGTFWVGEGIDLRWAGADWSILGLVAGYLVVAGIAVMLCRESVRSLSRKAIAEDGSMIWFRTVVREIFGLFVDDGSFALAILIWLAVCELVFSHFRLANRWSGLILFVGLSLILIENANRSTRRSRRSKQAR